MRPLARFHTVAHTPLRQWHQLYPDHRPLGIYNAYVPEEIFHAAGYTPLYVFHQKGDRGHARMHLPSFACWPGRSLVDQALSGDLDGLAGMAFAQTCDMVQALADIWRGTMPHVPVYHVGVPLNLKTQTARSYLIAELNLLRQSLGGIGDDALHQAFAVYNETRELAARLYDRAADLTPTEFHAAIRASYLMPKEEYNRSLSELLKELPSAEFQGPRLIVVGPHLADPALFQIIEAAGARVVDDLLDIGRRHYSAQITLQGDPVVSLADRLLATLPTPTKHHPGRRRDDYLVECVLQKQVDGVLFARQKFCDPHGFDYANLISTLEKREIPHTLIELEQTPQEGQIRTRVEAFLESLSP